MSVHQSTELKYRKLGQLIKGYRKVAKLTQKEFCESLDFQLQSSYLSHVETGRKRPSPEVLELIAKAFSLSRGQTLELFIAADYGMLTESSFSSNNLMMKTLFEVMEALPSEQELIAGTAITIFIDQVKKLVLIWSAYSRSRSSLYEGEVELSRQKLHEASQQISNLSGATNAYLEGAKGEISYRRGDIAQALQHFHNAFASAREIDDQYLMGLTTIHLGDIARVQGRWTEALAHYEASQTILSELNEQENMNRAQRNAAVIYLFQGRLAFEASKPRKSSPNNEVPVWLSHMSIKNDQLHSWQLSLAGDWEASLSLRHRILQNALASESKMNKMFAHMFVGDSYLQLHQFDEAELYYLQASNYFTHDRAEIERGYLLLGLARSYYGKGEPYWEDAEKNFHHSIDSSVRAGFKPREALARYYFARFLLSKQRIQPSSVAYSEINDQLTQSMVIFQSIDSPYYILKVNLVFMMRSLAQNQRQLFQSQAETCLGLIDSAPFPYYKIMCQLYMLVADGGLLTEDWEKVGTAYSQALNSALKFNHFLVARCRQKIERDLHTLKIKNRIDALQAIARHLRMTIEKLMLNDEYELVESKNKVIIEWLKAFSAGFEG